MVELTGGSLYTLQEHQTVRTNATISRNSDMEDALSQWRKIYLNDTIQIREDLMEIYI